MDDTSGAHEGRHPAARAVDEARPKPDLRVVKREARQPLRVLIVEDNPDDALLLAHQLRRNGYEPRWTRVETAAELRAALAGQEWDVILSDYSLPHFSGLDALTLAKTSVDVPFIIVSGTIGEDVAVAAMKAGAHDYLMKGNLARLAPAVERELREAVVRRQHRLAEEARWEEARIAETLARVGRELISSLDTPVVLKRLCQLTTEALGVEWSYALVWRPEDDAFIAEAGIGFELEEWTASAAQRLPRAALADLLAGLEHREAVPADGDACRALCPPLAARERQRGLYAALRRGPAVIGILAAEDDRLEAFGRRHERLAQGIAQLGSMALENARLVAELDQANRLKSEFMATMSHELRTPLHVILGYGELLESGDFDPLTTPQLEGMRALMRSARDLNGLISATLDFSRLEAGRMGVHWQDAGVGQLLEELRAEAADLPVKPGVRVEWQLASELPTVHTDPSKLKVVIKNLLHNACKFTERGWITVTAWESKGGVEFAVSDTGVGIAPDALPIIFEPYRQADGSSTRRFGGVGLGLHIVKRLLELIGGAVAVESQLGRGSTFRVWIPRRARVAPGVEVGTGGNPGTAPGGGLP